MDTISLKTIQKQFVKELQNSSKGQKTSLPFIVQKLPSSSIIKNDQVFQVLVIGGSVCKNALVKKQKKGIALMNQSENSMSPIHSQQDFFQFLESVIDKDIQTLAINFAYPLRPVFANNILDGILVSGSKENAFEGLVGKQAGYEIEKYIQKAQNRTVKVSVANDTICLLLSGLTKYSFDHLAAGVVGTGINFALFLEETTVVNLESAQFDKFEKSKQTLMIDKQSTHPGKALFEKETAGAYLYQHFNLLAKQKNLRVSPLTSTTQLSELADNKRSQQGELARALLKHSARLVACQIAGITQFKSKNMIFVMEGSLFWKGYEYKKHVEQTVEELTPQHKVSFVHIGDSSILGAAELVS